MESSQLTGDDGEECNSNESGWTMYLASPVSSDDVKANDSEESNVEDGSDYSNGRSKVDDTNYDDGDYDSLASDASTGPTQVKVLNGKEKKGHEKIDSSRDENGKDEQEEVHTKLPTSCNKMAGKMKKAEEKTTRRGYNKRRSSTRTSFFW
ncbi:protein SOB FIVE-LIKE 4-like [Phragmites australis]|uniref:protein SOB FIVE-LIKE 4-like n=1 Tax=Phragmites australis TaxID=29695 RepID=UPI002D766018|nr:protein SOB FIVE-LIKE 4-like [Phragmites australis]